MKTSLVIFSQILLIVACASVSAQTVTFELIPNDAFGAYDMSPDGRFIVGNLSAGGDPYLYDTQTGVMTELGLPGLGAVAVSDDGTVVLGDIPDPEGIGSNVAARWTQATGWVSLGNLPNAGSCPSRSDGYELSADGSVATGLSWDGCSGRGFYWTEATGMLELEPLANGGNRSSVVSADGTLFGGFAQGSFSRTPAIWSSDLSGQLLDPPDGDAVGEVHGIRDDGSILLGTWPSGEPNVSLRASQWTANGKSWDRTQIAQGSLVPSWQGIPTDIADNNTVVGFDIFLTARRAWIQHKGKGDLQELKAWANARGANIPSDQSLEVCEAISADGSKIIGQGFFTGSWIINIIPDVSTVSPASFDVTRGQYASGALDDLEFSDNMDVIGQRLVIDVESRVFLEVKAVSPTETPTSLEFTLEAAVFARSTVVQSIDLFDYVAADWEEVDVRDASAFVDQVTTVTPTGDLSRFVEPGTGCIEARARFESPAARQQFSANIDQTVWTIGQ